MADELDPRIYPPVPTLWEERRREMEHYYNSMPPELLAQQLGLSLDEVLPSKAPVQVQEEEPKIPNTAPDLEVPNLFE